MRHCGFFHQPFHVIAFLSDALVIIEESERDGVDWQHEGPAEGATEGCNDLRRQGEDTSLFHSKNNIGI